jgi:hypothetical protein
VVDAEAIGADIEEYGRVVLDGIVFEFDKAKLKPESKAALDAIAAYLTAHPDKAFYVVGHTDSKGTYAYNSKLSDDRARAVADALKQDYGIASDRLGAPWRGTIVAGVFQWQRCRTGTEPAGRTGGALRVGQMSQSVHVRRRAERDRGLAQGI